MTMERRILPGIDNSTTAKSLRSQLGITVLEWLALSMEDRLELITQWRTEHENPTH